MREDNRRMWEVLMAERRKNERIMGLLRTVWDVVGKGFSGSCKSAWFCSKTALLSGSSADQFCLPFNLLMKILVPPFPVDLLDSSPDVMAPGASMSNIGTGSSAGMHNSINMGGAGSANSPSSPNIYITSPTASSAPRFPAPVSVLGHGHAQNNISHSPFTFASPGSSPTAPEFGANIHQSFSQQGHPGHQQHPSLGRNHSFPHLQGHPPFDSSRSGSPNGTGPNSAAERDMNLDMFDEMTPAGHPGDGLNSASSSSVSVNMTGSSGDGHSPDETGANGLSARHGDGPGDEPGSQTVTGRGSTKRQRMSVSDTAPSSAHEQEMLMNSAFGSMSGMAMGMGPGALGSMNNPSMINVGGLNSGSTSSDSLLSIESNMSSHSLNLSLSNASLSPPENPKRLSTRARSDSAPLYHQQHLSASSSSVGAPQGWGVGRPRSGSGLGTLNPPHGGSPYGQNHLQQRGLIPSISMPRAGLNGVGGMGGVQTVPGNVQGQGR
ncbi:hypothetical protein GYMLUDRAFT_770533 [Collybiopsis luxurians FD-317 M1]|uniref:Unplaced genomic scaffold GYMLUscaffold_45, whole genome shotgun sequence n=1 Tax=Collybiopsis luxurians FD-317 M1 TaxID=944289 RepID=A0A0D0CP13_9AGAR|nr:hypothetical protein GYMLUDRAFT_770533 [Collybiopsis luxurians FD-317 M1]